MSLNWRGLNFTEHAPTSPREQYSTGGCKATRTFFCDWSDRYDLSCELIGYPIRQGIVINRVTPHPYHPKNISKPLMYATRVVECEPWGKPTSADTGDKAGAPTYTKARLVVEYETLPFPIYGDDAEEIQDSTFGINELRRYCIVNTKPAGEFLTLPHGYFRWTSDNTAVAQTLGKVDSFRDLVVIWKDVPDIPPGIDAAIGTTNKEAMTFYRRTKLLLAAAQDTLLLIDADPQPTASPLGENLFDITYRWRYRYQTHQRYRHYKPGPPQTYDYDLISLDGSSTYSASPLNYLFERRDHRYLFTFAPMP